MKHLALALSIAAVATNFVGCATTYRVLPIASPPASVRYDRGAPTTSLEQRGGAVQVTPMPMTSDGKLVFGVAAYNAGEVPANIGIENIQARSSEDKRLRIFTADDLVREARNKAIAASVAIALIGAAGAAASHAAAHQTYNSSFYTPRGAYHYRATYFNSAQAAAGTAASIGGATAGIYAVNRSLDAAIAGIGESVLQTTTVDPGETIGARVLMQRPRGGGYPQEIAMSVQWNGEHYPFRFQVLKSGDRSPASRPPLDEVASPAVDSHEPYHADDAPPAEPVVTADASPSARSPAALLPRARPPAQPAPDPGPSQARATDDSYIDPLAPPSYLENQ
ncbi:MAG: hypothetical protein ABR538_11010 [Candidatus Binatia bacterium]